MRYCRKCKSRISYSFFISWLGIRWDYSTLCCPSCKTRIVPVITGSIALWAIGIVVGLGVVYIDNITTLILGKTSIIGDLSVSFPLIILFTFVVQYVVYIVSTNGESEEKGDATF